MRLPFSIQVFLFRKQASMWSALLLQRNARPELALPDFWQGVSGALETGETFEDAAIREVFEETSIWLKAVHFAEFEQVFPIKEEWRNSYGPVPTNVQEKIFYAFVSPDQEPTLSHEHKTYRWCNESEAMELLTFANNALCAQAAFRAVRTSCGPLQIDPEFP